MGSEKVLHTDRESTDWRISYKGNDSKIGHIFRTEKFSDITFLVGENREQFACHKLVLLLNSSKFEEMFNNEPNKTEFVIKDVIPSTFQHFLQYIYTGEFDTKLNVSEVLYLIDAAKKFEMHDLIDHCKSSLQVNLKMDNALDIFIYAREENDVSLIALCRQCILKNAAQIVDSERFSKIDLDILCELLKDDQLYLPETHIFKAAVAWAKAACILNGFDVTPSNLRTQLGYAVFLIRFPLMSPAEFFEIVEKSRVLTIVECIDVHRFFAATEDERQYVKLQFFRKTSRRRLLSDLKLDAIINAILLDGNIIHRANTESQVTLLPLVDNDSTWYHVISMLDGKALTLHKDFRNVFMKTLEDPTCFFQRWTIRTWEDRLYIAKWVKYDHGRLVLEDDSDKSSIHFRNFSLTGIFARQMRLWAFEHVSIDLGAPASVCIIKVNDMNKVLQNLGNETVGGRPRDALTTRQQLWCLYPIQTAVTPVPVLSNPTF